MLPCYRCGQFVAMVCRHRRQEGFGNGGEAGQVHPQATVLDGGCSPWTDSASRGHGGPERKPAALFQGHLAGLTYALTGLIDYAPVANDAYVKEWVRQGYEFFRNMGLARIGLWGENITNNLPTEVAIKLSDAGVGDYWDDVDEYVRNTLVEDQIVDLGTAQAGKRKEWACQPTTQRRTRRVLNRTLPWLP